MAEAISKAVSEVLTSSNTWLILIFLTFFTVVLVILIKTGVLTLRTDKLVIGKSDLERTIIRQQIEWTKLYCEGLEPRLPHPDGYDVWRGKYVLECIYDEIVTWITFNHIKDNPAYIEIKQNRMINLVNSLTVKKEFQSKEFREVIKSEMEFVIKKLIQIRQIYSKGKVS